MVSYYRHSQSPENSAFTPSYTIIHLPPHRTSLYNQHNMTTQKIKYKISGFFSTQVISIVLLLSLGAYLLRLNLLAGSVHSSIPVPQHKKYPKGIPHKFDPDGNVQPFPGNTIICHLSPSSEIYASVQVLYQKLKEHPLSHLYTMLPPSSWHMTVFEGALTSTARQPIGLLIWISTHRLPIVLHYLRRNLSRSTYNTRRHFACLL